MVRIDCYGGRHDGTTFVVPLTQSPAEVLLGLVEARTINWVLRYSANVSDTIIQDWEYENVVVRLRRAVACGRAIQIGSIAILAETPIDVIGTIIRNGRKMIRWVQDNPDGIKLEQLWSVEEDIIYNS